MTIRDDEILKAACHGLLAGCLLPIIAYNLANGKVKNSLIYLSLLGFEIGQIMGHMHDANKENH